MSDEYKDTPPIREDWERHASAQRMDAGIKRSLAVAFRIKVDDDEAFADLADMFQRYRANKAFWADFRSKLFSGAVLAAISAIIVFLVGRYGNRF